MTMEPNIPSVDNVDKATEKANAAIAESRLTIDMILEAHANEREAMRKHYTRIILSLVLTLVLLVGSAFAGVIYVLVTYDVYVETYQELDTSGSGSSTIEDGIHYNTD